VERHAFSTGASALCSKPIKAEKFYFCPLAFFGSLDFTAQLFFRFVAVAGGTEISAQMDSY